MNRFHLLPADAGGIRYLHPAVRKALARAELRRRKAAAPEPKDPGWNAALVWMDGDHLAALESAFRAVTAKGTLTQEHRLVLLEAARNARGRAQASRLPQPAAGPSKGMHSYLLAQRGPATDQDLAAVESLVASLTAEAEA